MVPSIVTAAATTAAVQRLHPAPSDPCRVAQEAVELGTSAGFHGANYLQGFISPPWMNFHLPAPWLLISQCTTFLGGDFHWLCDPRPSASCDIHPFHQMLVAIVVVVIDNLFRHLAPTNYCLHNPILESGVDKQLYLHIIKLYVDKVWIRMYNPLLTLPRTPKQNEDCVASSWLGSVSLLVPHHWYQPVRGSRSCVSQSKAIGQPLLQPHLLVRTPQWLHSFIRSMMFLLINCGNLPFRSI
jgi:hypothetical protein